MLSIVNILTSSRDRLVYKSSYRYMVTTGDPVPVDQWDVPMNHFTG
jgi:hypothetical protein